MTQQPESAGSVPEWTLGWRLQRALSHAGMTVSDMAGELGVSRATISRWMNDHGTRPRTIYVRQWAMRTGVSSEWLCHGIETPCGPRPGINVSAGQRKVITGSYSPRTPSAPLLLLAA